MSNVLISIGRTLTAFALCVAIGGHWAVLQLIAWSGMIVEYSKDAPLGVAIEKTFDGAHPCGMCKSIEKAKTEEKKDPVKGNSVPKEDAKILSAGIPCIFAPKCRMLAWQSTLFFAETFGEKPPHFPPRLA